MFQNGRAHVLAALAVVLLVVGCTEAGTPTEVATVSASADLSPAYDAGMDVDGVTVSLSGTGDAIVFDLTVDDAAQTASGSRADVPFGEYTATVTVSDPGAAVGQASSSVDVRADTTISVTIVIDDPASGGGTVDVELE